MTRLWQIGDKHKDTLKWKTFRNERVSIESIKSNKLSKISEHIKHFNEFQKKVKARIA